MAKPNEKRTASTVAVWIAITGFLYSLTFVLLTKLNQTLGLGLSSLLLVTLGLLTSYINVVLYHQLKRVNPAAATWVFLLGSLSAAGAVIHGGYDLANAIHHPKSDILNLVNYPNGIDPRGILTFGLGGLAVGGWTWLMHLSKEFPGNFVHTGYMLATFMVLVYVARLTLLDPDNLFILIPAAFTGLLMQPLWYFWLNHIWAERRKN